MYSAHHFSNGSDRSDDISRAALRMLRITNSIQMQNAEEYKGTWLSPREMSSCLMFVSCKRNCASKKFCRNSSTMPSLLFLGNREHREFSFQLFESFNPVTNGTQLVANKLNCCFLPRFLSLFSSNVNILLFIRSFLQISEVWVSKKKR